MLSSTRVMAMFVLVVPDVLAAHLPCPPTCGPFGSAPRTCDEIIASFPLADGSERTCTQLEQMESCDCAGCSCPSGGVQRTDPQPDGRSRRLKHVVTTAVNPDARRESIELSSVNVSAKSYPFWSANLPTCHDHSQMAFFHLLRHLGTNGAYDHLRAPGSMQDDEALFLFGLIRTAGVSRVLELGGRYGFSARNFASAVQCAKDPARMVYTVDVNEVPKIAGQHRPIRKDAGLLDAADIGGVPVHLILIDCHVFEASKRMLKRVLSQRLLSEDGYIALHDTGAIRAGTVVGWSPESPLIEWLRQFDCEAEWQTIVAHDPKGQGRSPYRYGLTVMQRLQRKILRAPRRQAETGKWGAGAAGPSAEELDDIQLERTGCPVQPPLLFP